LSEFDGGKHLGLGFLAREPDVQGGYAGGRVGRVGGLAGGWPAAPADGGPYTICRS
jgi:hypothetical protein